MNDDINNDELIDLLKQIENIDNNSSNLEYFKQVPIEKGDSVKNVLIVVCIFLAICLGVSVFINYTDKPDPLPINQTHEYITIEGKKKELENKTVLLTKENLILNNSSISQKNEIISLKHKLKELENKKPIVPTDESSIPEFQVFIANQQEEIFAQKDIIKVQDDLILNQDKRINLLEVLNDSKTEVIKLQEEQISMYIKNETDLTSKLKKERWKGRLEGFVIGLSGGLLGGKFL